MEKKLTDEEIVKALECCTVDEVTDCENCPLLRESCAIIRKYALDLIHRLQAENERLTEENGQLKGYNNGLEYENTELQKQADELKLELQGQFDKGVKAGCLMSKVKEQQAVKDTAKEIYEILEKWAWKLKNEKGSLGNFAFGIETAMQEIKEKYSLQVANLKLVELKKWERK